MTENKVEDAKNHQSLWRGLCPQLLHQQDEAATKSDEMKMFVKN
jgi:hypothetical protein